MLGGQALAGLNSLATEPLPLEGLAALGGRSAGICAGADKVWHQALVLAVAADWDNELLDLGEVDHFNQALGYREWPKAESLIALRARQFEAAARG